MDLATRDAANRLVQNVFSRFFPSSLPADLGNQLLAVIEKQLGYLEPDVVNSIFEEFLPAASNQLQLCAPTVSCPVGWLKGRLIEVIDKYLAAQRLRSRQYMYKAFIAGILPDLPLTVLSEDSDLLQLVRKTVDRLPRIQRQLILLDLYRCLPPAKIQQLLGITSRQDFNSLKYAAFKNLKTKLRAALAPPLKRNQVN